MFCPIPLSASVPNFATDDALGAAPRPTGQIETPLPGGLVGDVGRNAARLGFALITMFFLFRDGETVLNQVQRVL